MAIVSIYLNFQGNTKEAFDFYASVFRTEYTAPILYNKDIPLQEGMPKFSKEDGEKVMYVCLSILGGIQIMGTDFLESMGHHLRIGNNTTICLNPDSREDTERLFNLLSEGSTEMAPLADQFWGAYWGCCLDKFGIRWMFNYTEKQ